MAFGPSPSPMGHLRGYSDFFASGFRAVSTGVQRRPASTYSATTPTDTDYESHSSASIFPNVFRTKQQPRQRRPMSMIISGSPSSSGDRTRDRRSSIVEFSSRLFDRMPFAFGDENTSASTSSAGKTRSKRFSRILRNSNTNSDSDAQELWISTGGPYTPSAPNGGPQADDSEPRAIDPFASSPESKSFFIDLASDSPTSDVLKRDSFLSMTTASNSSPSISLFHLPRKERPLSMQTVSLSAPSSQSRRSSFQCRGQIPEKLDSWILEEEADPILTPEFIIEDYGSIDDSAQIDWRQFHIDLLTVEAEV